MYWNISERVCWGILTEFGDRRGCLIGDDVDFVWVWSAVHL